MDPVQESSVEMSSRRFEATVIDAGVGNLGNLERALRSLGAEVERTDEPAVIERSKCLLLPGVGAFRPPRENLRGARELAIRSALSRGAFLIGICVGFQLLFESSEEFGETDGMGLVPGRIRRLPATVPLPHIGWNRLLARRDHPLLEGIDEGSFTYFVHSFAPQDVAAEQTLASCRHGRDFAAIVRHERVFGTQFHPEKSGSVGLRLLENFLELSHAAASGD